MLYIERVEVNELSLYDLYGHALEKKNPAPGVIKLTILIVPSLVIITVYLVFLINGQE